MCFFIFYLMEKTFSLLYCSTKTQRKDKKKILYCMPARSPFCTAVQKGERKTNRRIFLVSVKSFFNAGRAEFNGH